MLTRPDQTILHLPHEKQTFAKQRETTNYWPREELLHRIQNPRLNDVPAGNQKSQGNLHENCRCHSFSSYHSSELEVET